MINDHHHRWHHDLPAGKYRRSQATLIDQIGVIFHTFSCSFSKPNQPANQFPEGRIPWVNQYRIKNDHHKLKCHLTYGYE